MAQYAYNYNDIYDEYLVQAAPKTAPEQEKKRPAQPELQRIGSTEQQLFRAKHKKYEIAIAKISLIVSAFCIVILIASNSAIKRNEARQALAEVNAAYQLSLEQSNELKSQMDSLITDERVAQYAKKLGLVKIPGDKMRVVDITPYQ